MSTLKPLRWREGMFLRPQHFQQYDLFLEAQCELVADGNHDHRDQGAG